MLFDDYLIVDWSANARPKRGADSIWYCLVGRDRQGRLRRRARANPSTRHQAYLELRARLSAGLAAGRRCLIGFDFPNGYPTNFARAAGFRRPGRPPWRATWQGVSELIQDGPDNENNRFAVAARLNRRISGAAAPFWGLPPGRRMRYLKPTKPAPAGGLEERRICEQWVRRAQPVWKLFTTGSVGSQSLMGIPYQARLRQDPELAPALKVWPFETGLAAPVMGAGCRIVLAEVYPSLYPLDGVAEAVKDARQVEAAARVLAARDASGALRLDFAGPAALSEAERRNIESEEGWILGAGTYATSSRPSAARAGISGRMEQVIDTTPHSA